MRQGLEALRQELNLRGSGAFLRTVHACDAGGPAKDVRGVADCFDGDGAVKETGMEGCEIDVVESDEGDAAPCDGEVVAVRVDQPCSKSLQHACAAI